MKEDELFCRNCGKRLESGVRQPQSIAARQPISATPAWVPIVWLIAILIAGMVDLFLGVIALVGVTIWVYRDSKKYSIRGSPVLLAVVTFMLAIVGLPLYAYRLHQLHHGHVPAQRI